MRLHIVILSFLCLSACSSAQVKEYKAKVVGEYPHDARAYTQGLFFHDGTLYETTGQWGESSIRTVDLETGKPIVSKKLSSKYFGEGSAILDDELYVLTWTNKLVFKYDAKTLQYKASIGYPREGWGLTTDGKQLIASDGSSMLYYLDKDMKVTKRLKVTLNDRPLKYLNELEWIDGKIWANVYTYDIIAIINPSSGKVEATIDCSGILPEALKKPDTDVLNGIAVDDNGSVYITGKYWPKLYRIELDKKKR